MSLSLLCDENVSKQISKNQLLRSGEFDSNEVPILLTQCQNVSYTYVLEDDVTRKAPSC